MIGDIMRSILYLDIEVLIAWAKDRVNSFISSKPGNPSCCLRFSSNQDSAVRRPDLLRRLLAPFVFQL
jgi:hypothetical protein